MRVGMLTGSVSRQGGGVFDSIRGLSLALREEGVEIHVFGLEDEATEADRPAWDGLPLTVARISGPRPFGFARDLSGAIREAELDLLHVACTWMYPSIVSHQWAQATGRPVVVSPRGDLDPWALANSRWKKRAAAALFERRHLRTARCLHALNTSEAAAFRGYGLGNPIAIIPNGVDLPVLGVPTRASPPWQDRVPLSGKVLLFLGRLHPKKNLAALIEAWRQAALAEEEMSDWWLAIAGWDQGGHQAVLERQVVSGQVPRVLFLGPRHGADKDACFRSADAFTLPSLSEGLPRAVLEAWSFGLPVLITPACNLPEGVAAGAALETGSTAVEIAAGLARLTGMQAAERIAMGRAGRRLVETHFSWKKVAAETLLLYKWLVADCPQPRTVLPANRQSAIHGRVLSR
jgi:glycosyltransferase involved in cell wall biosynthesis